MLLIVVYKGFLKRERSAIKQHVILNQPVRVIFNWHTEYIGKVADYELFEQ